MIVRSFERQERQALMGLSILWSTWSRTTWLGTAITPVLTILSSMYSMTQMNTTRFVRLPITKTQPRRRNAGPVMSISSFPIWHSKVLPSRTNGQRGSQISPRPTALTAFGLTLVLNKTNSFFQASNQPLGYTLFAKSTTTLLLVFAITRIM